MTWFDILEKFQTLIVGVAGFTGVILTLVVQSYLSRFTASKLRENDAKALRAVLRALLLGIQASLISRIELLERAKAGATLDGRMNVKTTLGIYQVSWPKLGLLTFEEIDKISTAFAIVGNIPEHFYVAKGQEFDWSKEGNVRISADDSSFGDFWNIHITAGDVINDAIDAIDNASM